MVERIQFRKIIRGFLISLITNLKADLKNSKWIHYTGQSYENRSHEICNSVGLKEADYEPEVRFQKLKVDSL